MSTRPRPEDYPTAWSYFHASWLWRKRTGGSLIAGGITGSQLAVVVFIALAVVVTLARRWQP